MSKTASIHVLHVDDDPDFVDIAAEFLEREDDVAVETTTSASEGLDRLAADDFDCIVSDYDMPGQNGIEFLKQVRDEYPDLPFILYTGKGSEEGGRDVVQNGIGLCKLHHWAFDVGWLAISDDYKVVVSEVDEVATPDELSELEGRMVNLPSDEDAIPAERFLREHRKLHGFE